MCLAGASWVQQNILEKDPAAELRVYTVWLPMLATDARSEWDPELLDDPRVQHFWDEQRISGEWLADPDNIALDFPGPIVWDAYVLFGPDAQWRDSPSDLVGAGWTVIATADRLERELASVTRRSDEQPTATRS